MSAVIGEPTLRETQLLDLLATYQKRMKGEIKYTSEDWHLKRICQLTHPLGGRCRTFVGFPPSGSRPGVFERQLPPKLHVARMHGSMTRATYRTTHGAAERPRPLLQDWAYPMWDHNGHLKGRRAGAPSDGAQGRGNPLVSTAVDHRRQQWRGGPTARKDKS